MYDMKRIEGLILKLLRGTITENENKELQRWVENSEENRRFMEERMKPEFFFEKHRALRQVNTDRLDLLMKIKFTNEPQLFDWIPEARESRKIRWYSAAAILLIVVGSAWWYHQLRLKNNPAIHAKLIWHTKLITDSEGSNVVRADSMAIGELEEGVSYSVGHGQIVRMGNQFFVHPPLDKERTPGSIDYTLSDDGTTELQLFFPDTIRAQLSPSSLVRFSIVSAESLTGERQFYAQGDVLFNIGHNYQRPFKVKTNKQEVSVLGTLFRVRDFKLEDTGAVFCYDGAVKVNNPGQDSKIIKASQRATVHPNKSLRISTGDFPNAKWSSPELLFDFTNMNLEGAMHEVARWYGVDSVQYGHGVDKKTRGTVLTGRVSRYLTLPQLLELLDRADLHFSIEGNSIWVRK